MIKVKISFFFLIIVLLLLTAASILYAENNRGEIQLSLPDKTWALGMDLTDFKIEHAEFNNHVTGRVLYATNERSGEMIKAHNY